MNMTICRILQTFSIIVNRYLVLISNFWLHNKNLLVGCMTGVKFYILHDSGECCVCGWVMWLVLCESRSGINPTFRLFFLNFLSMWIFDISMVLRNFFSFYIRIVQFLCLLIIHTLSKNCFYIYLLIIFACSHFRHFLSSNYIYSIKL